MAFVAYGLHPVTAMATNTSYTHAPAHHIKARIAHIAFFTRVIFEHFLVTFFGRKQPQQRFCVFQKNNCAMSNFHNTTTLLHICLLHAGIGSGTGNSRHYPCAKFSAAG
jgi:hypothetical protein